MKLDAKVDVPPLRVGLLLVSLVAVFLALCSLTACRDSVCRDSACRDSACCDRAAASYVRTASWLDGPDLGLLAPQQLLRRQPVLERTFEQPADLDDVEIEPAPEQRLVHEQGVQLDFETQIWVTLRLPTDFQAKDVDAIEFVARGLRGRPVLLTWTSSTDVEFGTLRTFSPERLRRGLERYRFPVQQQRGWAGRIRQLELRVPLSKDNLVIQRISAYREEVDPRLAEAWQVGTVQVDLAGDVRAGRLLLPGDRLRRRLVATPDAELRAAIGVPVWSRPARFQVALVGRETPLAEWRVEAADGWRELRVPLASLLENSDDPADRRNLARDGVELELRLRADVDDAGRAAGLWAHPAVYDRASSVPKPRTAVAKAQTASTPPLNVVLISVDTLRADHLSLYGYERSTSPHLDRWAAEHAVVFDDVVAPSPWTLPSHTSMFSGIDAHRHGVNLGSEEVPAGLHLLAEHLRDAGYTTQAFTGGGYLHPRYGLAQGFDGFRYWRDRRVDQSDDELLANVELTLRWLETHADQPFFLFLHTYEVHGPLRARQPFYEEFGGRAESGQLRVEVPERRADEGFVRRSQLRWKQPEHQHDADADDSHAEESASEGGASAVVSPEIASRFYDSSIAYFDRQLSWVLAALDRLDLTRRTVVVLTSDHGELLGEHGVYNHYYLYDENLQVPLVLAVPGSDWAGRRVDAQVRTVDIVPTLLDVLGLPPAESADGVSLVDLAQGHGSPPPPAWSYAASTNYGVALQDGSTKVIDHANAWPGGQGVGEEDLGARDSEAARRLLRQLRRGFVRQVSGTRLRIQNPRDRDWYGRVRSSPAPLFANNLKAIDLHCPPPVKRDEVEVLEPLVSGAGGDDEEPAGEWLSGEACLRLDADIQTAHFRIPAGQTFTLFFESETDFARFHVLRDDGLSKALYVHLDDRGSFRAARFDGKNFELLDRALRPDEVGVMLWWDGLDEIRDTSADAEPLSAELQAQLRALGYLQ